MLAAVLVLLAGGLAGCGGDAAGNEPSAENEVSVELGEQNDSGQTGEATLRPHGNAETVVILEIEGGDEAQPAHVHTGTCEELGDVAHALENVEGGRSETTVPVSLDELQSEDFAINVHKSEAEIETYVACADLGAAGAGAGGADEQDSDY